MEKLADRRQSGLRMFITQLQATCLYLARCFVGIMLLRLPDGRGSCKGPLEASFLLVNKGRVGIASALSSPINAGPKLNDCILHGSGIDMILVTTG